MTEFLAGNAIWVVPVMLFTSSVIMAFAWLGHLRFRAYSMWVALLGSWFLVIPEYMLNVYFAQLDADAALHNAQLYLWKQCIIDDPQ